MDQLTRHQQQLEEKLKLEAEADAPKTLAKEEIAELKDKVLEMVKGAEEGGGIDIDKIILELKEPPEIINSEIKKLLEDGVAYEPQRGAIVKYDYYLQYTMTFLETMYISLEVKI